MRKAQQGFTLIEIIAVLVILGILAAVAVPKFIDLQDEARIKSYESLIAAGQSALSMEYARLLLVNNGNENATWTTLNTDTAAQAACDKITMDGFDTGVALTCTAGTNVINLVAGTTGQTTSGQFTNPGSL